MAGWGAGAALRMPFARERAYPRKGRCPIQAKQGLDAARFKAPGVSEAAFGVTQAGSKALSGGMTTAGPAPKLAFHDVLQVYDGARGTTHALDSFNLEVRPGEAVAILGPSGCGKSTSLLLACGLLAPTQGEVLVDGARVARPRLETALILQDFGLMPWKTVEHNAGLGLEVRRVPKRERVRRVAEALARVGLSDFAAAYPAELSGGMRQRLAMARALACDIDLLLMDEPLSALDALLREDMQNMLKRTWKESGYAQVLVTHSIEEAVFLGQRVIALTARPGRVAQVIENAEMDAADWRANPLFFERCRALRDVLRANAPGVGMDTLSKEVSHV